MTTKRLRQKSDSTLAHHQSQDDIYARYEKLAEESRTRFGYQSEAYRFTNEPLGDLLSANLSLKGPVLTITASGDPICLFAGLGAQVIDAVDVSYFANGWAEYKLQGLRSLDQKDFWKNFADEESTWGTFPFDLPVSAKAKSLFAAKAKSPSEKMIRSTDVFQNAGYAAANPHSAGCYDPERYSSFQQRARDVSVRFFPADFTTFYSVENIPYRHYGTIYVSNVLDHLRNPITADIDFTAKFMDPVVDALVEHIARDGQLIFNFQWGNRALGGAVTSLARHGFMLSEIERNGEFAGCGAMYIAQQNRGLK